MLGYLKKKLSSESGAMDKILVTLLFVIIGVTGIIGLSSWVEYNKDNIQMQAVAKIELILEEDAPASGGN